MTEARTLGQQLLCKGNRTVVLVSVIDGHQRVEKKLRDFANVATERRALFHEARIQAAADGRGIVPVVDKRFSPGRALIEDQTETGEIASFQRSYVKGYSLRDLAESEVAPRITPWRCAAWFARLARILARVHDLRGAKGRPLGLVHRDVTWSNVLVGEKELSTSSPGEEVLLNDFGLAHVEAWGPLPLDETLQGAPRFLSPELKAGQQPSSKSDVYQAALSLCAVLGAINGRPISDLFEEEFSRAANQRARELLGPWGAEDALDSKPANRPTALELANLLDR